MNEKGFTLLEMVIGVFILSIILGGISRSVMGANKIAYKSRKNLETLEMKFKIIDNVKNDLLHLKNVDDITTVLVVSSDTEFKIIKNDDSEIVYRYDADKKFYRNYNAKDNLIESNIESFKAELVKSDKIYFLVITIEGIEKRIQINRNRWNYEAEYY